jgi:hypothetical protein
LDSASSTPYPAICGFGQRIARPSGANSHGALAYRLTDYQSLIDGLTEPAEVFVLDSKSDGLSQISDYLSGQTDIDALHIISHGSEGTLYLGNSVIDSGNLAAYQTQLANIGKSLTETGDTSGVHKNCLSASIFTGLALTVGMTFAADNTHLLYNSGTEALSYDANLTDGIAAVQFATLYGFPPSYPQYGPHDRDVAVSTTAAPQKRYCPVSGESVLRPMFVNRILAVCFWWQESIRHR